MDLLAKLVEMDAKAGELIRLYQDLIADLQGRVAMLERLRFVAGGGQATHGAPDRDWIVARYVGKPPADLDPSLDEPPPDLPDNDPDIGQDDRPLPPDPEATAAGLGYGLDLGAPNAGDRVDTGETAAELAQAVEAVHGDPVPLDLADLEEDPHCADCRAGVGELHREGCPRALTDHAGQPIVEGRPYLPPPIAGQTCEEPDASVTFPPPNGAMGDREIVPPDALRPGDVVWNPNPGEWQKVVSDRGSRYPEAVGANGLRWRMAANHDLARVKRWIPATFEDGEPVKKAEEPAGDSAPTAPPAPPQPGDEDCRTPQEACLTCKDWGCQIGIGYRLDRTIAQRQQAPSGDDRNACTADPAPAEVDVPVELIDPPPAPAEEVCVVNLAGPKVPGLRPAKPSAEAQRRVGSGTDCVDCPEGKECSGCDVYARMQGQAAPQPDPAPAPDPKPACTACGLSPADGEDGLCKTCRRGRAEGASVRGKVARKRELPPQVDLTIRATLLKHLERKGQALPMAVATLAQIVIKERPTTNHNVIGVELSKMERAGLIQRVDRGFYAPKGWAPKRG